MQTNRKSYTEAQRKSAIKVLEQNGYNLYKTSRQTGITATTLRRWLDKYAEEQKQTTAIEHAATINYARIRTTFIQENYDDIRKLMSSSVKKAMELLEVETDLNKVNNLIKTITEFAKTGEDSTDGQQNNTSSLIKNTILHLNQINIQNQQK